ncbi:MAG: bifunctional DNA primase/polymerase [Alphaproteobacteria bacterium]|nr:bifunctional DNA primase/polymerase [Alphaproteobacteria bacterium]
MTESFFDHINNLSVPEALLAYLDKGIVVFPLRPDDPKVPAVTWKPYQTQTPTIFEAKKWIRDWPKRKWELDGDWPTIEALAIATGTHNNLYVLDTDTEAAEAWVRENAPPTPLQAITRKGRHFFYRPGLVKFTIGVSHGPDHLMQTNAKGVRSTGIDSRGEGGYVVAPPSIIAGHKYQWKTDAHQPAGTHQLPNLDSLGQAFFVSRGTPGAKRTRMAAHEAVNADGGPEITYDTSGLVAIGCRDFYMRDLVMGIIASEIQETGQLPSAKYVAETAWRTFQQRCDMSDDIPKFEHCLQKAEYTLQRIKDGTLVIHDDDAEIGDAAAYEEKV